VPLRAGPVHRVLHHGPLLDIFVLDCRAFRSPNAANTGDDIMLGAQQVAWLGDALAASKARWKLIACDQPISLLIDDGPNHEGFANGDPGAPSGRERELAQLLTTMKERNVHNTLWITADVHYTAAHQFDPRRAASGLAFDPFWEFIAGPIHAGNFGPNELDATLGPAVKFQWGTPPPDVEMLSPLDGKQSFGTLDVTRDALVVALRDLEGRELHRVELTPV
jgi:alkaline phosphatase D